MHSPAAPSRPSRRWLRPTLGAAVLVPALAFALLPSATAAPSPAPASVAADAVWQYQVRAQGVDAGALAADLVAAGYDVAGRSGDVVFVLGGAATRSALTARSSLTVVRADPVVAAESIAPANQNSILPRRLDGRTYPTFYGGYRTVAAYEQFEDDLEAAYPELVQVVPYGQSFSGDHPLRALCVTSDADQGCDPQPDVDKARFLLMGQIHAREVTTSEITWRLITTLVDGDGRNADISAMLDETEIWIIPQTNPDGIELTQDGLENQGQGQSSTAWQRKNVNPGTAGCGTFWSQSQRGVDLNRNYDAFWGGPGSSGSQCNLTYRGTSAASEPETSDLQNLLQTLFEDQRGTGGAVAPPTTRGAMISLHTYSNLVLFPYGSGSNAPNDAGLRSMAFRMSNFNGYQTGRPNEILYEVTGSTDDFAYQDLGIAAFTYEIGPASGRCGGFFPDYSCQADFFKENRNALLYGVTAAQQPYTQSLGPTILKAKSTLSGSTVTINGTADDDAYGTNGVSRPSSQNVTEARLFVGTAPWDGGTPQPLTVNGSGKSVTFTGTLTAAEQRVPVYLQARDAAGNWGPTRVVWRPAL